MIWGPSQGKSSTDPLPKAKHFQHLWPLNSISSSLLCLTHYRGNQLMWLSLKLIRQIGHLSNHHLRCDPSVFEEICFYLFVVTANHILIPVLQNHIFGALSFIIFFPPAFSPKCTLRFAPSIRVLLLKPYKGELRRETSFILLFWKRKGKKVVKKKIVISRLSRAPCKEISVGGKLIKSTWF